MHDDKANRLIDVDVIIKIRFIGFSMRLHDIQETILWKKKKKKELGAFYFIKTKGHIGSI